MEEILICLPSEWWIVIEVLCGGNAILEVTLPIFGNFTEENYFYICVKDSLI